MIDEATALEIAKLLKQGDFATVICKKLGVSGRDVGRVHRMMREGIIVFNEYGEPKFTVPFEELEPFITRKRQSMEQVSRETVAETYRAQVAKAAKDQTDAMFILANALWQAIVPWFMRRGYTLEDLRTQPIHKIVLEYLDKGEKYDQLLPEYESLKREIEELRLRAEPFLRLERAMTEIIPKTYLYLAIIDEIGNAEPLAEYYSKCLNRYLKGAGPVDVYKA